MNRVSVSELERRVAEGKLLRRWIVDTGRTPSGLARDLGVKPWIVSAWIEGASPISDERRGQLQALGYGTEAA